MGLRACSQGASLSGVRCKLDGANLALPKSKRDLLLQLVINRIDSNPLLENFKTKSLREKKRFVVGWVA